MQVKVLLSRAPLGALFVVGCAAAPPSTSSTRQGITAEDVWSALDVVDAGPTTRAIGVVDFGGYSRLGDDRHLKVNALGLDDVTVDIFGQDGTTQNMPAFSLSRARAMAKLVQSVAHTAPLAPIKSCQATTSDGDDLAMCLDALRTKGAKQVVSTWIPTTITSNLRTALRAAATAHMQILFPAGRVSSGYGYGSINPIALEKDALNDHFITFAIAITVLMTVENERGWSEQVIDEQQATEERGVDASAPGSLENLYLPTGETTYEVVNVSNDPAVATGLAGGGFVRNLSLEKPADLTSPYFYDVAAGEIAQSCVVSACKAQTGQDGPTNFGTPKVSQFGSF